MEMKVKKNCDLKWKVHRLLEFRGILEIILNYLDLSLLENLKSWISFAEKCMRSCVCTHSYHHQHRISVFLDPAQPNNIFQRKGKPGSSLSISFPFIQKVIKARWYTKVLIGLGLQVITFSLNNLPPMSSLKAFPHSHHQKVANLLRF